MEWGSSYIYDYQGESSDEELSVGELEEGMYLSDSDEEEAPSLPPSAAPLGGGGALKRSGTAKPQITPEWVIIKSLVMYNILHF